MDLSSAMRAVSVAQCIDWSRSSVGWYYYNWTHGIPYGLEDAIGFRGVRLAADEKSFVSGATDSKWVDIESKVQFMDWERSQAESSNEMAPIQDIMGELPERAQRNKILRDMHAEVLRECTTLGRPVPKDAVECFAMAMEYPRAQVELRTIRDRAEELRRKNATLRGKIDVRESQILELKDTVREGEKEQEKLREDLEKIVTDNTDEERITAAEGTIRQLRGTIDDLVERVRSVADKRGIISNLKKKMRVLFTLPQTRLLRRQMRRPIVRSRHIWTIS